MYPVSRHIRYLLQFYDSVSVAGLGTFFSTSSSPDFDPVSGKFVTSFRRLDFKDNPGHGNERLLAESIARKNRQTASEAAHDIENFSTAIRKKLKVYKKVMVEGLGVFQKSGDQLSFQSLYDDPLNNLDIYLVG